MLLKINKDETLKIEGVGIPPIYMSRDTYNIMIGYAKEADGEIGGLAEVERYSNGLKISNPIIIDQETTAGTTDLDATALANFFRVGQGAEAPEKWRCWWHSHVDMKVYYSSVDKATAAELSEGWPELFVGLTVNRKGEIYSELRFQEPFPIVVENTPVYVHDEVAPEVQERIKRDIQVHIVDFKKKLEDEKWDRRREQHQNNDGYRPRPGFMSSEEPMKSGKYDRMMMTYRHKQHGYTWDYKKRKWWWNAAEHKGQLMKCQHCDVPFPTLMYQPSMDMWMCKPCRMWDDSRRDKQGNIIDDKEKIVSVRELVHKKDPADTED